MIEGKQIIGFERVAEGSESFHSFNLATEEKLSYQFNKATSEEANRQQLMEEVLPLARLRFIASRVRFVIRGCLLIYRPRNLRTKPAQCLAPGE